MKNLKGETNAETQKYLSRTLVNSSQLVNK